MIIIFSNNLDLEGDLVAEIVAEIMVVEGATAAHRLMQEIEAHEVCVANAGF